MSARVVGAFGSARTWAALASLGVMATTSLYAAGCDGDTGDASAPPWTPGQTVAPAASSAPRRTIEDRNPFGNTDAAANLMADGDFELTGRQDQMPWQVFGTNSQATLNYETGGRCRSGVRCGAVTAGSQIIGWMSSPPSGAIRVSFWVHPSGGTCHDFSARVLDIDDGTGGTPIYPTEDRADARGWCHFAGFVPNMAEKSPVLYGTVSTKAGVTLIDDAVAEAAPPGVDAGSGGGLASRISLRFSPEEATRFHDVIAWIRAHRRYGRPPERTIEDPRPRFPVDR